MKRLIILVTLITPLTVYGQYFGRNKVKYEDYNFRVLHTEHFSIHYYKDVETEIADFANSAEDWYTYQSELFYHQFTAKNPIIFYANDADFQQTSVISSLIGEGTGGVTEGIKNRVILPMSPSHASTEHVLGHELVHAFQYDMLKSSDSLGLQSAANLPLWLVEGMAEYLSIGSKDALTAMWMRDAVLHDDIPDIDKLTRDMSYFPYRYGHSLVAFIAGEWGDEYLSLLLLNTAKFGGIGPGVFKTFHISCDSLSSRWKTYLINTFKPQLKDRVPADSISSKILAPDVQGGRYNVAPVLSPNGKYVAYFSERDIFTFDLFLADANTGKVIKKLASQEADAHFNAIRFIESAGTWSPDSKRFATVTYSAGNNDISIFNIDNKAVEHLGIENIGTIYNPAWSPDGKKIAFTGTWAGVSDLFLYDLERRTITRLTDDHFANLQPCWSSDGKTIAFITDRTPIIREYGNMKIGMMDLESREIQLIEPFSESQHFNPQFSHDGNSLFFISDRGGYSDVYRQEVTTGEVFQITNVPTGVSGITNLSPALSLGGDKVFFSTYLDQEYIVYALNREYYAGKPVTTIDARGDLLPPLKRVKTNKVDKYLADMPYESGGEYHPRTSLTYRPRLSLDYLGNVAVGVGVSSFGLGVLGGVNLRFSDMLNERILYTGLALYGSLQDISAQVAYLNQKKRMAKGGLASHMTYLSIYSRAYLDSIDINDNRYEALVIEQDLYRTFNDQAGLIAMYPVSTNHRLELSGGWNRISYDIERISDYYVNGVYIKREEEDLEAPSTINLFSMTTAWVGDKSYFGMTSPLKGQRYRLEANGVVGSLSYMTFLADYRKYQFVKPFTLAGRVLHYGRYFGDAEDRRLTSNFIGYGVFVRGYGPYSYNTDECVTENGGGCPVTDRLFGSRMLVGNFEVRYPLIGARQLSPIPTRILPVTVSAFFDIGMAWWPDDPIVWKLSSSSLERVPVMSSGVSARVNLAGAMILEIYYAYPYQRPVKGGHVGLVLAPGW